MTKIEFGGIPAVKNMSRELCIDEISHIFSYAEPAAAAQLAATCKETHKLLWKSGMRLDIAVKYFKYFVIFADVGGLRKLIGFIDTALSECYEDAMYYGIAHSKYALVKFLLPLYTPDQITLRHCRTAVAAGSLDIMILLLSTSEWQPNTYFELMATAISNGRFDIVEFFLDQLKKINGVTHSYLYSDSNSVFIRLGDKYSTADQSLSAGLKSNAGKIFTEMVKSKYENYGVFKRLLEFVQAEDPARRHENIRAIIYYGKFKYYQIALDMLKFEKHEFSSVFTRWETEQLINYGRIDFVKESLKRGWDPSGNSNHALNVAVNSGNLELVRIFLKDCRVNPTCSGNQPIITCATNNDVAIAEELLKDPRVDPYNTAHDMHMGISAFDIAVTNGLNEMVQLFTKWKLTKKKAVNTFMKRPDFGDLFD